MEKPYDLKALGELIVAAAKQEGLTLAEESVEVLAKAAYIATKEWAKLSAQVSENKIDDFIAPFYDQMDEFVLPQIQKVDLDGDGD